MDGCLYTGENLSSVGLEHAPLGVGEALERGRQVVDPAREGLPARLERRGRGTER